MPLQEKGRQAGAFPASGLSLDKDKWEFVHKSEYLFSVAVNKQVLSFFRSSTTRSMTLSSDAPEVCLLAAGILGSLVVAKERSRI